MPIVKITEEQLKEEAEKLLKSGSKRITRDIAKKYNMTHQAIYDRMHKMKIDHKYIKEATKFIITE